MVGVFFFFLHSHKFLLFVWVAHIAVSGKRQTLDTEKDDEARAVMYYVYILCLAC